MKRAIAMLLLLAGVPAQAAEVGDYDRFRLWNDCLPVTLIVEGLGEEDKEIGLTEDRIRTIAESRLRAARLYTDGALSYPYLYVRITVYANAFNIDVDLYQSVQRGGLHYPAITWEAGITGTHGGNAGFILQSLSEYMDEFINDYLRVNEAAC